MWGASSSPNSTRVVGERTLQWRGFSRDGREDLDPDAVDKFAESVPAANQLVGGDVDGDSALFLSVRRAGPDIRR